MLISHLPSSVHPNHCHTPYKPPKPKQSFRPIRTAVRTNHNGNLMYYYI